MNGNKLFFLEYIPGMAVDKVRVRRREGSESGGG